MKCEQIEILLSSYVDGMVDDKDKAVIDAHIAICPKCRQQVEDYRHIANMMRQLEPPSLPDNFSAELNRRVLDEQNKILGSYILKTPKKSGWFAAALAVLALTGGIYASSYWSLGSFVTSWHESKENQKKPLISIDSIITRFQNWKNSDDSKVDSMADVTPDDNNKIVVKSPAKRIEQAENTEPSSSINDNSVEGESGYTATVKVENIEDSLPRVLEIAANYGADYTIIPPEENMPEDSQRISQGILLEVEQSEADKIMKELKALGSPIADNEATASMQAGDSTQDIDSANQEQLGNEEPQVKSQAESPAGQVETSEHEVLIKEDAVPDQPGDENNTTDKKNEINNNNNEIDNNKVIISIYLKV